MARRGKLLQIQPVLPSKDVEAAIRFYVERLNFKLGFHHPRHPAYAGVHRDAIELHLQWHDPAEWSAVDRPMLRIVVSDPDALFEEFKDAGVFHAGTALRDTPWGTREFAFYDGDGNGLTFYRDR